MTGLLYATTGKWRVGSLVVDGVVRAGSEGRGRNRKAADRDSAPRIHSPTVDRGAEQERNTTAADSL